MTKPLTARFPQIWLFMPLLLLGLYSAAHAEETTVTAHLDADGVQRAIVVGGSYFFKPNHIVVKAHVPVELTLSVEPGRVPHDFKLQSDEARISIETDLDTTPKKVTFTPEVTGKFPFYCTRGMIFMASHREKGMEGVLEVTP